MSAIEDVRYIKVSLYFIIQIITKFLIRGNLNINRMLNKLGNFGNYKCDKEVRFSTKGTRTPKFPT